jgi:hypothetical protein
MSPERAQSVGYRLRASAVLLCVALPLLPLFGLLATFAYWLLLQAGPVSWWQSALYWAVLAVLYASNIFSVARFFAQRILSGQGIVLLAQDKDGGNRDG